MKLMFRMLIDKKVFYKLIILFLMGLARDAQSARLNLRCLCDISRKKTGMKLQINCTAWFKSWSYNSLYIQCSPTIDPFLLLIWNPCQAFSLHLIVCVTSSCLLFQVMIDPCKLACLFRI